MQKHFEIHDNQTAQSLFGPENANLKVLARRLEIDFATMGNRIALTGEEDALKSAVSILNALSERISAGEDISESDVRGMIEISRKNPAHTLTDMTIKTPRKTIHPRSTGQEDYLRALETSELVFGLGPAGTGKTYLAVAKAVEMKLAGKIERIILTRPAVEAGERLGFLPGDLREKIDPYLRPLYDALYSMLPGEQVTRQLENGEIEIAPLAYMRGRTLYNAFVILDEGQNTTVTQMMMFLTRLGENSRMVVTGDLSQIDLPAHEMSGLKDAVGVLEDTKGSEIVTLTSKDVQRHPLVARIADAYAERDTNIKKNTDM